MADRTNYLWVNGGGTLIPYKGEGTNVSEFVPLNMYTWPGDVTIQNGGLGYTSYEGKGTVYPNHYKRYKSNAPDTTMLYNGPVVKDFYSNN